MSGWFVKKFCPKADRGRGVRTFYKVRILSDTPSFVFIVGDSAHPRSQLTNHRRHVDAARRRHLAAMSPSKKAKTEPKVALITGITGQDGS